MSGEYETGARLSTKPKRIGIDFDNTLISYDAVFIAAAKDRGLLPNDFVGTKRMVRDAIRRLPNGELSWQALQGYVYGTGISAACLVDGVDDFLRRCRTENCNVFIISHKTKHGHFDPKRVDLREAAENWLAEHGFFSSDIYAIPKKNVFFNDTRSAKLECIRATEVTHFIDDLEEVLADPKFPSGVERILLAETTRSSAGHVTCCLNWSQVTEVVFGKRA